MAEAVGGGGDDMLFHLGQTVGGGTVSLQGTVQLPSYMPIPVPVGGVARFRDDEFDVVLSTPSGIFPELQLVGVGNAATLAIEEGVMVSSGGVVLPFASAVWTAVQTQR